MKRENNQRSDGAWLAAVFLVGFFVICSVVLGAGLYKFGYDNGQYNARALTAKPLPRSVFDCNPYPNPYFGCSDWTQNMTGLYCHGQLVCERKWEDP